jgi:hypothetical protein
MFAPRRPHRYYKVKHASVCGLSGAEHGKLVHAQVDQYIKALAKTPLLTFGECFPTGADRCALSVVNVIQKKGWIVIGTEFMIFDDACRVATAIDLLVKDPVEGSLIIIDIKTGYTGEEYGATPSDPKFAPPFQKLPNCPRTRHMLQLMGMREMLTHSYKISSDEAYILRVMPALNSRANLVKMDGWCRSTVNRTNIYELLKSSSNV